MIWVIPILVGLVGLMWVCYKKLTPKDMHHHYWINVETRRRTEFTDPEYIKIDFAKRRYTQVLQMCVGCGDYKTVELDGHWPKEQFVKVLDK